MKKVFLVILALSFSFLTKAQTEDECLCYDKWSLDLGFGIHEIGASISDGYSASNLWQGSLGARYMFNEKFGIRLDLGYNKFEADDRSLPFSSEFYRASIEGVVNLGNLLKFNSWSKRFNFLAHGGFGGSILNISEPNTSSDDSFVSTIGIGVTPQFKISDRIAIFADFSSYINFGQKNNFDGTINSAYRESNISFYNTSIGLNISLGKNGKLADFYNEEDKIESELDKINKRLTSNEEEIAALKAKEASDIEAIIKELDSKYVKKDEVNRYIDFETGDDLDLIKLLLNRGYINVYFDVNKSEIRDSSLGALSYLKQYMNDNPNVTATLIGYADETGSDRRNKEISQERAKVINDMLVSAGIDQSRLTYAGAGVDKNVGKDARQFARRVTFKIN